MAMIAALARNRLIEQSLFDQKNLASTREAVTRAKAPLRGRGKIGCAGRIISKHKVAKHFNLTFTDSSFFLERRQEKIAAEAALDGIYVVRTEHTSGLPPKHIASQERFF